MSGDSEAGGNRSGDGRDLGTSAPESLALDPFEFHGHPASSIAGLGGSVPLPDTSYAFHTCYVPVARGHAHFLVRFEGLQARQGSLILRVHMLPDEPGAVATMVTSHRVQLAWLAHHGGQVQLRFEAFRGARYAIMGVTPDQLDASADALTVSLDRPATPEDLAAAGGATEARSTIYASDTIRAAPVALLVSIEPPLFAQPVSQSYTPAQTRERAFRDRCAGLAGLTGDAAERWQAAYVLQVLDRYGALRAGARGLTLGHGNRAVATAVAKAGAALEQVTVGSDWGNSAGNAPAIATETGALVSFDFLMSFRATDDMVDSRAATRFLERSMECLRPGGLAVHVVGHRPDPMRGAALSFDRNGLERLAFALISSGHQLARLKPPAPMDPSAPPAPFGLVARRGAAVR